jgi:hypothetical protein
VQHVLPDPALSCMCPMFPLLLWENDTLR